MEFFKLYIKSRRWYIMAFICSCAVFFGIFRMYRFPLAAILYPALISTFIWLLFIYADISETLKKHRKLNALRALSAELIPDLLPKEETIEDSDYCEIIRLMADGQRTLEEAMNRRYADTVDYYTVWAHQIKTPIAAMRLRLQNEDSPLSRSLTGELNRIEQYVEMVLVFLRLGSDSTDYVFRETELDSIVRPAIKRFAGEFIGRGLSLSYSPLNRKIITDEKWLGFVIEQLLSNALKYTPSGSVSIYIKDERLCIEDTGIGINAADLPRVFENGYTGYNGRLDKKASGIGLYLCREICRRLGLDISIASEPDVGTTVMIALDQYRPGEE